MSKESAPLPDSRIYVRDIQISLIDQNEMAELLNRWIASGRTSPEMDAMMMAHKRNLETLTAANRAIADGVQELAQAQTKIMRDYMESLSSAITDMVSAGSPEASARRQAEFAKKTLESAVANMREFAEMTSRSGNKVFEVVNREVMRNLDQLAAETKAEAEVEAYQDLRKAIRETQAAAQRAGITQDDVDRELALRKAERLSSRR